MRLTLLIANRGEIACRIIKTAKKSGIRTVAVYSEADESALHVKLADEAYYIGPALSQESYLVAQKIIDVAVLTGATLIHPGYGFLSENAEFAELCAKNNLTFIGPPVAAIEAMGSKSAAKQIMEKANVPLVPGYHGNDQNPELLQSHAQKMGYPVLLKAAAGGGGKGMRQVWSDLEFKAALDAAKREAMSSFNDDKMLVEKYLTAPRHIEIQVFCDTHGNGVYLFERDCSVQRRHQKVIEEAPAPGLSEALRTKMGAAALKAAKAINYVGAGTVEFLLDQDDSFYFMEMNTRLQVEHPVTEMITGQDLVQWQIQVALGHPLPCHQDELSIHGHAFEARIYAEDPDNDFLPATGLLSLLQAPEQSAYIRVDTGVQQGDAVSIYYDPMIAKLIVWSNDRQSALSTLIHALNHYYIDGVVTNIAFLTRITTHPTFNHGVFDTGFIEKHKEDLFAPLPKILDTDIALAALLVIQSKLHPPHLSGRSSPWLENNAWRLNSQHRQKIELLINGVEHFVSVTFLNDENHYKILIGDHSLLCEARLSGNNLLTNIDGHQQSLVFNQIGQDFKIFKGSSVLSFCEITADLGLDDGQDAGNSLTAPMNGRIVTLLTPIDKPVEKGQALLVMEAMKMEQTIHAPSNGRVEEFFYEPGDLVDGGATLLAFSPMDK